MVRTLIVPNGVLDRWPDRWRYPRLLIEAAVGIAPSQDGLVAAVLNGLAHPHAGVEEVARSLQEAGEYLAAEAVLREASLDQDQRLVDELEDARRAGESEVERAFDSLRERARRAGSAVDDGVLRELLEAARRRRADAEARLATLEQGVREAETAMERVLRTELAAAGPGADPEWVARVEACLEAGELPAAAQVLHERPSGDRSGPFVSVWMAEVWPWERPFETIVAWYSGGQGAPVGFAERWLPAADDHDGRAAIRTVADLHRRPTEAAVEAFAAALDRLAGVTNAPPYRVEATEVGFRTFLRCLSDPRLPWLRLPRAVELQVVSRSWRPTDACAWPVIWFVTEPPAPGGPPGSAVLDPTIVMRLVARDETGSTLSPTDRRINLLREVCRRLRLDDVLGSSPILARGANGIEREHLAWMLNVLGVRATGSAVDVLRYETGGNPAAVHAALSALAPDSERPARLAVQDVAGWARDPDQRDALRAAMVERLVSEDELAAVVFAAMSKYEATPEVAFTADDVRAVVEEIAGALRGRERLDEVLDVQAVLARAGRERFLQARPDGQYRLGPPALLALLAPHDCQRSAREALTWLLEPRTGVLDTVSFSAGSRILRAMLHVVKNDVIGLREELAMILKRRSELDDRTVRLVERARAYAERLESLRHLGTSEMLAPADVPLADLLSAVKRRIELLRNQVIVDLTVLDPVELYLNPHLLEIAFENLALNAAEATLAIGRPWISVTGKTEGGEVVVDFEDSGPGLPEAQQDALLHGGPFPKPRAGRGSGLPDALELIRYCRGTLRSCPEGSAVLGGAHLQVRLPLSRRADP
jgi:signal transduction histidine kinase